MLMCVCGGGGGRGGIKWLRTDSHVWKIGNRTVIKNLIRLKFNKRISHQISNSNVFEM